MYCNIKRIHLIGIGGIGMSGIAQLLLKNGYEVTGSDLQSSETIKAFQQQGIRVDLGHRAENVHGAHLVVHTSAAVSTNPELVEAKKNEIPIIPRAEMLAELMRLKYGIAIAGAHGKTTTTSMASLVLLDAGLDPAVVVGGRVDHLGGGNSRAGNGNFMVVEADESDGSFNKLSPSIAVVTNLDREHMDHYKGMEAIKKAFLDFVEKVPFYGVAILCGDDPYLQVLHPKITRRKKLYGFATECHYQILSYQPFNEGSRSEIRVGMKTYTMTLQIPGKHNALNALAALAVGDELKIPIPGILSSLEKFKGAQRRFQIRGVLKGVTFVDDYAHHPSEIRATLQAARERFPRGNIRVVFQPHRYSRVEDLYDQFVSCFHSFKNIAITDIYAASEKPIAGIHSKTLAESIANSGVENVIYRPASLDAVNSWVEVSQPGDVVLTLGAGDLPAVYKNFF